MNKEHAGVAYALFEADGRWGYALDERRMGVGFRSEEEAERAARRRIENQGRYDWRGFLLGHPSRIASC